jgi:hypothetical protein
LIYFSDDAPEGLTNSLQAFPNANKVSWPQTLNAIQLSGEKLGLIASSTPFITGRPFTLFENKRIHSTGAVGIALMGEHSQLGITFPEGLNPITSQLTITR